MTRDEMARHNRLPAVNIQNAPADSVNTRVYLILSISDVANDTTISANHVVFKSYDHHHV